MTTPLDLLYKPSHWEEWVMPMLFDDEEVAGLIVFMGCEFRIVLGDSSSFDLEDQWLRSHRWDTVLPFHTHPLCEYRRSGVPIGWPSRDDVALFMRSNLEHGTRRHVVFAMEGMYVMSIDGRIKDPLDIERTMTRCPAHAFTKTKHDSSLEIIAKCRRLSQSLHPVLIRFHHYYDQFILLSP